MKRPRVLPLLAVLTAFSPLASPPRAAHATTVVPVTVEELAHRADEVVVATPRAQASRWLGRTIVTDVVLEVQTVLRGSLVGGARVTLQLPGGAVGRIAQMIPGAPAPQVGTPYVFFLSRAPNEPGLYYVTHLTASVLPLAPVPNGGGAITVMPTAEGLIARATAQSAPVTPARPTVMTRAGVPLEQLASAVRSAR